MWLLKLPFRFLVRQSWWAIRLFSVGLGVLVYKIASGQEVVAIPGMEEPYVIGTADPFIAAGVVYFVISRGLLSVANGLLDDVSQSFGRSRGPKKGKE